MVHCGLFCVLPNWVHLGADGLMIHGKVKDKELQWKRRQSVAVLVVDEVSMGIRSEEIRAEFVIKIHYAEQVTELTPTYFKLVSAVRGIP